MAFAFVVVFAVAVALVFAVAFAVVVASAHRRCAPFAKQTGYRAFKV